MGQVSITVGGRNYQVACDDGQEQHLIKLAGYLEKKMDELNSSIGTIGDTRLMLMASLIITDELFEQKNRMDQTKTKFVSSNNDSFEIGKATKALQSVAKKLNALADKLETA